MYDDADDVASWDPLFGASPDVSLNVQDMSQKRSASVLEEPESPRKRQKQSEVFVDSYKDTDVSLDLPQNEFESSDAKAVRRARNTAAARRSRDKKRERLTELEARVAELERLNTELSVENQFLRTMKSMPPRSK